MTPVTARTAEKRPLANIWREVSAARLHSALEPATSRRTRWWVLTLTCGHQVERHVRYRKTDPPLPKGTRRSADDLLPALTRVACPQCRRAVLKEMFS